MSKRNLTQFLIWMRNGIAFCSTWFLILMLVHNSYYDIQIITTDSLIAMMLFVTGGVFLFSFFFTQLFIKKWSFIRRLTCFLILFCIYECIAFYRTGLFVERGTPIEWMKFTGIVLGLYLICIFIYRSYSKKKGELYTQALQQYQQQRSIEHGK